MADTDSNVSDGSDDIVSEYTVSLKAIGIVVLFIIAAGCGAIPLYFIRDYRLFDGGKVAKREQRIKRMVGIMNAFSGGVFLGISLIHLIPTVRTLFLQVLPFSNYPWGELFTSCGFLLIAMIEQIMLGCGTPTDGSEEGSTCHPYMSVLDDEHKHDNEAAIKISESSKDVDNKAEQKETPFKPDSEGSPSQGTVIPADPCCDYECRDNATSKTIKILNAFVLLVALSVHSFLEGIALGLQLTRSGTIHVLIALSLHKGIESFTLSLSFVQTTASRNLKYVTFVLFCVTSPIGIAVGILMTQVTAGSSESDSVILVNGIFQGLATGTFLFVAFIEILPQVFKTDGDRLIKFIILLIGFGIMAAVAA